MIFISLLSFRADLTKSKLLTLLTQNKKANPMGWLFAFARGLHRPKFELSD
jgi:hypothetical protein